jgi:hypothetical protein
MHEFAQGRLIRHVVLFKFNTGVTWEDPRAVAAERVTANHPKHIEDILGWESGRNLSSRPVAYDFALVGTFADEAAIERYLNHPDHLRGVRLWGEIATWVIADLPVPLPDTGASECGVSHRTSRRETTNEY